MKRKLALFLALTLALASLAACGGTAAEPTPTPSPALSPEELAASYAQAIEAARSDEDNQYIPATTEANEMTLELLGFTAEDVTAYAAAVSLVNIRAYGVAVVKPAEGREEAVREGLQGFIDRQKQSFEQYLVDQYDIAAAARLEALEDGTLVLVMCEGQDAVYDAIAAALGG